MAHSTSVGQEAAPGLLPALHDPHLHRHFRERARCGHRRSRGCLPRAHQPEWAGIEKLPGTYPFTLDRSVKAYRLNHFLHDLIQPEVRARFLSEPEVLFEEAELTTEERNLLRTRDWRALIHYGVIFFLLEKLGAVIGTTNLHIYAAMRGQSLEDFQKTRNSQILYSVAGGDGRS